VTRASLVLEHSKLFAEPQTGAGATDGFLGYLIVQGFLLTRWDGMR